MTLTVGSLFAGIGGFDLGLERAGMTVRWQVENNPFSQHILNKHWPDVPCYGDIRGVRGKEVEPVDIICGGFPCQDISLAGKGEGIEGARSGLWSEYARLVGEIRPRYVIVENVAALRRRGLDRVLADLSLLGYDAEWDRIRASDIGAPHQRARLWLVAYPQESRREARNGDRLRAVARSGQGSTPCARDTRSAGVLANTDGVARDERWVGDTREGARGRDACGGCLGENTVANANGAGRAEQRRVFSAAPQDTAAFSGGAWSTEPDVGRVAHGVPARVDRLTGLGNALVPQIAEWIGRRILAYEGLGSGEDAVQGLNG